MERVLIVTDGGLNGLVAAAAVVEKRASRGDSVVGGAAGAMWLPAGVFAGDHQPARERAVDLAAGSIGFDVAGAGARPIARDGLWSSAVLLEAANVAARARCRRIQWAMENPIAPEPEDVSGETVAKAIDRCLLVERLVACETGRSVSIEAPMSDLSDRQVADLALDLAVPLETLWWWDAAETPEFTRWRSALERCGWTAPERVGGVALG